MFFLIKGGFYIKRKFGAILLVFMILIFTIDQQKKEAQAFLPLFGLAPEVVSACAALLTAAGIEFATDESVRAAGYKFYTEASDVMKSGFDQAKIAGGVLVVTAEMWLAIKAFAKTNFVDNTTTTVTDLINGVPQTITATATTETRINLIGQTYGMMDYTYGTFYADAQSFFPAGFGYITTDHILDTSWHYRVTYHNTSVTPNITTVILTTPENIPPNSMLATLFASESGYFLTINGNTVFEGTTPKTLGGFTDIAAISTMTLTNSLQLVDVISPSNYTVNNNYYNNSAIDYGGHTITVPTTIPGVAGKTAGNVAKDSPEEANNARKAAIAAALAAGLTLAQATAAGDKAFSDAMTNAVATTNTFLETITMALDFTAPINLTPLNYVGTLFTTRFPFSLPWDVKNMLTAFGTGSVATPTLEMPIMGVPAHVSLSRFDGLASAVRVFELLFFNAGLLFGTRKLLGGAS
jgi:hypothetical protein